MHFKLVVVAFIAVISVPVVAQVVEISSCSTVEEIKKVYLQTFENFNKDEISREQGLRMLECAKSAVYRIASAIYGDEMAWQKYKEIAIGAIVSNTENGLGVLALMRILKANGYTNIKIVAVQNATKEPSLTPEQFRTKVNAFNSSEILWFHILEEGDSVDGYLTSDEIVEKMKNVQFLVDGLIGGEYRAIDATKTLVDAFKILTGLSPKNRTKEVFIMSHVTPSGRSENGKWENDTEFVCSVVVTTTYALPALEGDAIPNILAHPKIRKDDDSSAAFLTDLAANSNYTVDVAAIKQELKKVEYTGWLVLTSKN